MQSLIRKPFMSPPTIPNRKLPFVRSSTSTTQNFIKRQQWWIPPSDVVKDLTLPLTLFDMEWLHFHPVHRLHFFDFPCSVANFRDSIVPKLKKSLSLTLKHFLPMSGNLVYPLNNSSGVPVFRYKAGNSVSFTIAESSRASDFYYLSGNINQTREADEFYAYVPGLPPGTTDESNNSKIFPLLSTQVTLIPEKGICVGISFRHVIGDASTIVDFTKTWSSITKFGGDEHVLSPFYERSIVKDPTGLATKRWNHIMNTKTNQSPPSRFPVPTNRIRTTYSLTQSDIKKLKAFALAKRPTLVHASSFTLVSAFVWTCLVKAESACGARIVHDGEPEYFCFPVDARARCNPPLPSNYLGNCLASGFLVESTHGQLMDDEGFLTAVELIGQLIAQKVKNGADDIMFEGAQEWMSKYEALSGKRIFGVAESLKFDVYDVDFGWGRPKKFENVSIDEDTYSACVVKSRDVEEGNLEITMSLPTSVMNAFSGFFADELQKINAANIGSNL